MVIGIDKNTIINFFVDNGLPGDFKLQRLSGGANNKVFKIVTDKSNYLLKIYFKHPDDPRDRLKSEFSFCKFAWGAGLRSLPQPVACEHKNQLALYEFIEGRHLNAEDITPNLVSHALDFYQELNNHKLRKDAEKLAFASEACFSIEKHLACIESRIKKLNNIEGGSAANLKAMNFVNTELTVEWKKIRNSALRKVKDYGLAIDEEIKEGDRCISPSDFGFHNAILTRSGSLSFIDFEYAGWDDPAKMVCDFFSQPKAAVPFDYFSMFARRVVSNLPQPEKVVQRIYALFPLYQLKWCCILLNDFLPVDSRRRRFASEARSKEEFKIEQLHKARKFLKNFKDTDYSQLKKIGEG